MKILVTGATGFVGQEFIRMLASKPDVEVVALVRDSGRIPKDLRSRVDDIVVAEDIATWRADPSTDLNVDVVVHLAGYASAGVDLEELMRTNVGGAVNVAKQSQLHLGAKRFVYVSSIKAMGESSEPGQSLAPDERPRPEDDYGRSKLAAEDALREYAAANDLDLVIVRPPVVYGERSKGSLALLRRLIEKGIPLPIGRIRNKRSFIAVGNLCDVLLLCSRHREAPGETFHVSDMHDLSTLELAESIASTKNKRLRTFPIPVQLMSRVATFFGKGTMAQSLIGNLQVDASKAKDLLGWRPPQNEETQRLTPGLVRTEIRTQGSQRMVDILLSGVGLLFLWPLLGVIYVLGIFDTGSPLFKQERVGLREKPFTLLKFRTMRRDTKSVATHLVDATSVTRLGGILRRTKLDELPQLINVFRGDMSLVGPRPCLFSQTELIEERRARGVFDVRPGITGLGQVTETDMSQPQKLARLDEKMIQESSLKSYFRYLLQTVSGSGMGDRVKH